MWAQLPAIRYTGAAAIDVDYTCGDKMRLVQITYKFDSAPTTSENITGIKDSGGGAGYDTTFFTRDPSAGSDTSYEKQFDPPIRLAKGDIIKIDYTNTDTNTYGLEIILETRMG